MPRQVLTPKGAATAAAAPSGANVTVPVDPVEAALRYDAWYDGAWGSQAWRAESAALLAALGPLAEARVLDVGCGPGRFAALLRAHGARPVGVDLDPGVLTVAVSRLPGQLVQGDGARLPFVDGGLDATVALATMEFTADPGVMLAEMVRVTRPGGRVVAGVLNPRSLWGVLDRPTRRDPYHGASFLRARQLRRLGLRYGAVAVTSAVFSAPQLTHLPVLPGMLERLGPRLWPRAGALQIVTVLVNGRGP
jgi:SAM-dependent methyltransferase